jgi:hypothetical protein
MVISFSFIFVVVSTTVTSTTCTTTSTTTITTTTVAYPFLSLISLDHTSTADGVPIPHDEIFNCRMFNLLVYGNPQKVLMDKCMVWWICPTTHNKMWAYIAASYSSLCNNPHHAVFMVDVNYDDRNDSTGRVLCIVFVRASIHALSIYLSINPCI